MQSGSLQAHAEAPAGQTEVLSIVLEGSRAHQDREGCCSSAGSLPRLPQTPLATSGISPHPSSACGLLPQLSEAVLCGFELPLLWSEALSTLPLPGACCLLSTLLLLLFTSVFNLGQASGQWVFCVYLLCEIGFS